MTETDPVLEDVPDDPDDPAVEDVALIDEPEPMQAGEDNAETDPEAETAAGTQP